MCEQSRSRGPRPYKGPTNLLDKSNHGQEHDHFLNTRHGMVVAGTFNIPVDEVVVWLLFNLYWNPALGFWIWFLGYANTRSRGEVNPPQ